MVWIICALLAAFIWSLVNHIDKYLLSEYCKNASAGSLVLFSSLIGIPVVILLALFLPDIYSISYFDMLILVGSGIIWILAIILYLYALGAEETSVVAPQMILSPVLTAIMSALILHEILSGSQIITIIIILVSSLGLSFSLKTMTINYKVFLLMLGYSFLVALNTVLFKLMSVEVGFWMSALWTHVGFVICGIVMFFGYAPYRRAFIGMIASNGSGILTVNIFSEIITIVANLIFYYATLFGPVALVQSFTEGIQPIFVFLLGIILSIIFPKLVHEDRSMPNVIKKTVFISMMIIGICFSGF